ncbi:MAG: hypothetical protein AAF432_03845 [Planctomycetota bacterium]
MAQFKPKYAAVVKQLQGMSMNARLLIGALVVILALSLILVADYAGRPDLVPLAVDLNPDSRAEVVNFLRTRQIRYREEAGDLMVPIEERYTVLSELQNGQMISSDQIDFDQLVQQDSPFMSRWQNQKRWLVAKMNVVGHVVSGMKGIRRATVLIDVPEYAPGIGRSYVAPSASVSVETDGTTLSQDTVDAIARMVAGAHAQLTVENVAITDLTTGKPYRARDDASLLTGNYLEVQQNNERMYFEKIERALGFIPGVNIAVNVIADAREVRSKRTDYENPKLGVLSEQSRNVNSLNQKNGPARPGMEPNTGLDLASSAGSQSSMSDEQSSTRSVPAFGNDTMHVIDGRGYALKINATIGVPKSYFVGLWRDQDGAAEGDVPDPAALQTIVDTETARIRAQVEPLIDTGEIEGAVQGMVSVSMYNDVAVAEAFGGTALGGWTGVPAGGDGSGVVGGSLVKYLSLGGLAVISLAMMFMMVRKAGYREELPSAEDIVGIPPALADLESELVGEAVESDTPMDGVEIDDDTQRRNQMLEQINDAAKEQPEEMAAILRRWIRDD